MRASSNFILGFHGCDQSIAMAAISEGKHLKSSRNEYDWLGHGIYFWENDPGRALEWAKFRNVNNPAVVGAIIDTNNCLDLTEIASLELVRKSYDILKGAFNLTGNADKMPENKSGFEGDQDLVKRNLDCMVINYLHSLREIQEKPPFNLVRCPFTEGIPLYKGAKIMSRTHIQLCVRDNKQILGYFKPLF